MSTPSTASRSRAWVDVDLDALRANLRRVMAAATPSSGVLPMVKADAYGVGAAAVVRAMRAELEPAGPWGFGVATVAEGERLREHGWRGRVLVAAPVAPDEYDRAARAGLTPSISALEAVERWRAAAGRVGGRHAFHVEVDTGMGRAGLPWDEAASWCEAVVRASGGELAWEGCFTHFHSADEADLGPTRVQWSRFSAALREVARVRPGPPPILHAANSAAALRLPECSLDLVRPGISLYGGRAGPGTAADPVVQVRARVLRIARVSAGATLGYGATYTAAADEIWGTVGIGYGDGLPRALGPAGGEAILRGRRVPIVGRISMDVTVLNLSRLPSAEVGDVVTLIGREGEEEITLEEVAERCGTISYEILTGLTPRLPRVYRPAVEPH